MKLKFIAGLIVLSAQYLLVSIEAQPLNVKEKPTIDWMNAYRRIQTAFNENLDNCSKSSIEESLRFLEHEHEMIQYCANYGTPSYVANCYTNIAFKFQNHFVSKFLNDKCLDRDYSPILDFIQNALKIDDSQLIASVYNFGQTQLVNVSLDLKQIYDDIVHAFDTENYGCFLNHMDETKKFLEEMHSVAQQCYDNSCYSVVSTNLKSYVEREDQELAGIRCFDFTYAPIRSKLHAALQMRTATLIDAVKVFANAKLNLGSIQQMHDPPSDVITLHSEEQFFNNPESETIIDFAKIYEKLNSALQWYDFSCFQKYLKASKDELKIQHVLGQICLHYSDHNQRIWCFKDNYLQLLDHFQRAEKQLKIEQCSDSYYEPIFYALYAELNGNVDDAIEALKVFSENPIGY